MTDRKALLRDPERIVVKVGTSSITAGGRMPSESFLDGIAAQVSELQKSGKEVILVSSGAIGIGVQALGLKEKPREIPLRQAAASVGQGILMQYWNGSFQKYGLTVAQILITMDDYADRETVLNLNNTLSSLLAHAAVPVFNENDAICVKEIGAAFGDNDTLSAVIASRLDADLLIILSDVAGLYDRNPMLYPDAHLVPTVTDIGDDVIGMAGDPTTKLGIGGMKTKIRAAQICRDAGCRMIIASSAEPQVIERAVAGEEIGTVFAGEAAHVPKKRRWMKAAAAKGTITVDVGAGQALTEHRSLLPVGIVGVTGDFRAGDVVDIRCGGELVAKGVPDYTADEIQRIAGMRSEAAKQALGGKMVHKDAVRSENLVLMP
ncbi:MAG: glutamate 5-kinase [Methanomethylophilus sp.]